MKKKLRLALFISGGGTTASAIIRACKSGKLSVNPVLVVASKAEISGINRVIETGMAKKAVKVISPKKYDTVNKFGEALLELCRKFQVDLIGQYGWLPLTPVNLIRAYDGRIINQHPGPLDSGRPDFGGKGMYGKRVHTAILYFRRVSKHDYWTEATTHFVTQDFDRGEVIKRKRVKILPTDTVEDLQKRVLPIEHEVQIEALADFAAGKVRTFRREKELVRDDEVGILKEAKRVAEITYPRG